MNKIQAKEKLLKLDKEREKFLEIINKPVDLFEEVDNYSDVCEILGIEEKKESDFNSLQEYLYHQIKNIEKLFNGNWIPDWSNPNQAKFYPYFYYKGSRLVFGSSGVDCYSFHGQVAYFRDRKTSDFIGQKFAYIYIGLAK